MKLQPKTYTWLSWIMCVIVIVVYTLAFSTKVRSLEERIAAQEERHIIHLEAIADQMETIADQSEQFLALLQRYNQALHQLEVFLNHKAEGVK